MLKNRNLFLVNRMAEWLGRVGRAAQKGRLRAHFPSGSADVGSVLAGVCRRASQASSGCNEPPGASERAHDRGVQRSEWP